jgi:anaerobic magnesium-protoporphyrin IX monomethyl ester cyclase
MKHRSVRPIRKAVFINPYPSYSKGANEATVQPPLGIAYIASSLEKHLISCQIIDAHALRLDRRTIYHKVKSFKPDLIGITTNIVTVDAALSLGKYLKSKFPKALLVFGGPYATGDPAYILRQTKGDIVVIGEGEETIVDIAKHPGDLPSIPGIYYRKGNIIRHTNPRPLITDLDSIPFPAYHLLPDFSRYRSRSRRTPIGAILTTRGCPYGCIFCNKNIFGKTFRMRSPSNILTEMELLTARYGVRQIDILDDNFTLNTQHAEEVLDQIIQRNLHVLLHFQSGVRADRLTPRLVTKMKRAGTYKAGIGIESGDPAIQKIIKKSLSLPQAVKAVTMLRKAGIVTVGFFMFGIPGETGETMQKTIDFAKKVNPHIANFSLAMPLPQTELFDIIKKKGKFLKTHGSETGFFTEHLRFEIGEVNEQLIRKYMHIAYKSFYLRPSKIIDVLFSIRSYSELKWVFDTATPLVRFLCP